MEGMEKRLPRSYILRQRQFHSPWRVHQRHHQVLLECSAGIGRLGRVNRLIITENPTSRIEDWMVTHREDQLVPNCASRSELIQLPLLPQLRKLPWYRLQCTAIRHPRPRIHRGVNLVDAWNTEGHREFQGQWKVGRQDACAGNRIDDDVCRQKYNSHH